MEAIVRHVNKSKSIQDAIVASEDSTLIHATYRLFLNYGFSMEYFIKAGFHYELSVQGVESIFRENRKMNHLIKDFFEMTGGKFDYIIDQILQYSTQLKPKKHGSYTEHSTKKVFLKCMNVLNEVLIHTMSDVLIDFCTEVCMCINSESQEDRAGENIVCSFIIFRLLAPRLLDLNCCGTTPPDKILTVVKLLNRVASSPNCMFNENNTTMDRLIQQQNRRFTTTVARALLKHREANYCYLIQLTHVRYSQSIEVFLKGLSTLEFSVAPVIPLKMKSTASERRLGSKGSFEDLLKDALSTHQNVNIKEDLEYFLLWSAEDVLNLVQMENLDITFFKHWRLNGDNFMKLTPKSLKLMGMTDSDDIEAVMDCIDDLRSMIVCRKSDLLHKSVSKWSQQEVFLWLIISDLSDLLPLFRSYKIDGQKMANLTIEDLIEMKITCPEAITKLMEIAKYTSSEKSSSLEES